MKTHSIDAVQMLSSVVVAAALLVGAVVLTTIGVAIVCIFLVCETRIDGDIGADQRRCSCLWVVIDIAMVIPTAVVVFAFFRINVLVCGVSITVYLVPDFIDVVR